LAAAERSCFISEIRHRLITLVRDPVDTDRWARAVIELLVVNGAQYVIDAGEGVTRRLTKLGTNFRNIDNIFITHPHSDHTGGLGGLMGVVFAPIALARSTFTARPARWRASGD